MKYKLLAIKNDTIQETLKENIKECELEEVLHEYKTTVSDDLEIYYVPQLEKNNKDL